MDWVGELRERARKIGKSGQPIDPGILPLVIGLWACGIRWTLMSCQGNTEPPFTQIDLFADFAYCPWVMVSMVHARKLAELVSWQNRPIRNPRREGRTLLHRNRWTIFPWRGDLYLVPEDRTRSLEDMQQGAIQFGRSLLELGKRMRAKQ
jgi:hypothetical protein